jgi:hypothetical protein
LPICSLSYDGKCELNIVVNIQGVEKNLSVLVDTGFTSGTGFGLKLPTEFARYAKFTGTGYVRVADGRQVAADSIPDAKIMQIGDHKFGKDGVTIPTLFMSGPHAIGVMFLQLCILNFDGPNRTATINHVP